MPTPRAPDRESSIAGQTAGGTAQWPGHCSWSGGRNRAGSTAGPTVCPAPAGPDRSSAPSISEQTQARGRGGGRNVATSPRTRSQVSRTTACALSRSPVSTIAVRSRNGDQNLTIRAKVDSSPARIASTGSSPRSDTSRSGTPSGRPFTSVMAGTVGPTSPRRGTTSPSRCDLTRVSGSDPEGGRRGGGRSRWS